MRVFNYVTYMVPHKMQHLRHLFFEQGPKLLNRFQNSKWSRSLKVIGVIVSLSLFVAAFASSISQIDLQHFHVNFKFLLATIVTIFTNMCVGIFAWTLIARALNGDISPKTAITAYLLSVPAKYLPGIAWNYLGKIALLSQQSLRSGVNNTLAVIFELSTTLTSGLWVACLISLIYNVTIQGISAPSIKLILTILALLICFAVPMLLTSQLRKYQHSNSTLRSKPILRVLFFVATLQSINWVLLSLAFWFSCNIINTLSISYFPECIVAFSTSFIIGFIAFFAPNGIGIREVTLMSTLNGIQQPYVTLFSSTVIRLIYILIETISFLGALYIHRRFSHME